MQEWIPNGWLKSLSLIHPSIRNPLYDTINIQSGGGAAMDVYHTIANPNVMPLAADIEPQQLPEVEHRGNIQGTDVEMEEKL